MTTIPYHLTDEEIELIKDALFWGIFNCKQCLDVDPDIAREQLLTIEKMQDLHTRLRAMVKQATPTP